ncbi:MAG: hypothetical protein KJT03_24685 [Verrucomicrobiae bacterium]|nr:hypothetical protein [Verrucomicrobiae bacterium]
MNREEGNKQLRVIWIVFIFTGIVYIVGVTWIIRHVGPDCSENSEAAAYARTLSQERLSKLYYDMERLSATEANLLEDYWLFPDKESNTLPEPFTDIKAGKLDLLNSFIMLEGCFDEGVVLSFEGIGDSKEFHPERRIILSWGEFDGNEILWKETVSN